jgi:hypothetical protein
MISCNKKNPLIDDDDDDDLISIVWNSTILSVHDSLPLNIDANETQATKNIDNPTQPARTARYVRNLLSSFTFLVKIFFLGVFFMTPVWTSLFNMANNIIGMYIVRHNKHVPVLLELILIY